MSEMVAPTAEPRLLIVDDDPGTIRLLINILQGMGKIQFATSGAEAIGMVNPSLTFPQALFGNLVDF